MANREARFSNLAPPTGSRQPKAGQVVSQPGIPFLSKRQNNRQSAVMSEEMGLSIGGNGDMLLHQLNDPINKNAQFGVDMAVRRKGQVQGHWMNTPIFK